MHDPVSLKSAERKAFQITFADGLWDVLIGCILLEFAISPFFSDSLGDFWSSVIFLPFWGLVYLAIWLTRKYVVAPRIGKVVFGRPRLKRLRSFGFVMMVTNAVVFLLGLGAALVFPNISGGTLLAILGLFLLGGFSAAAYLLDYPRLYVYGLLLLITPPVGEWLYVHYGVPHHGFPISFGITAGLMILVGLITFFRLLKNTPKVEIPDGA